ncbi:hypothetical protein R3I93_022356 [Phoxinus phoxinus]|uniref:Uncharacterized protein n=1 Tax=Phoxinus phoxinus TaxID=58324 RepID=A0AAN9C206_9TELE
MAFNSPTKIPHAEGEQFVKMRNQFCLLAYSVLDEAVGRIVLHQELTELGVSVMRKVAALDAEKNFLRKELADTRSRLEKTETELEVSRAALDFAKDDILELEFGDGEDREGADMPPVEED